MFLSTSGKVCYCPPPGKKPSDAHVAGDVTQSINYDLGSRPRTEPHVMKFVPQPPNCRTRLYSNRECDFIFALLSHCASNNCWWQYADALPGFCDSWLST